MLRVEVRKTLNKRRHTADVAIANISANFMLVMIFRHRHVCISSARPFAEIT